VSGVLVCAGLAALAAWLAAGPPVSRTRIRAGAERSRSRLLPRLPLRRAAEREREHARAVEACGVLAVELRAGRPPAEALAAAAGAAVGDAAQVLSAAAVAAGRGGDVAGVLAGGAAGTAAPALLRGLAACWSLCASTGGGLAVAAERLQEAERDAADRRRAVDAELAGPRATAGLLAGLPLLGVLLGTALGADPLRLLLTTPLGLACLALGLGLDGLGLWWSRRLASRAISS
jgi:tight adherence protein B